MAADTARRKSVMGRSIKLGHCVCNPLQPCPCDRFREFNICQCAGEKMPAKTGSIRLTQHIRKAGCASKIAQADLLRILGRLPVVADPNILVGVAAGDDAGVYRLDDQTALVQTVDVFTPCVDDPYLFGRIAAANSVSDVYAMGGRPLTALSIAGFPIDDLDGGILEAMLRGGMDTMAEARCPIIGGHSINDEEIKLGYAVTGLIHPSQTVQRNQAHPGDVLVLTKPLGTGMISFAAQLGLVSDACLQEVGASMATLNRDAAELMLEHGAHACTDITGYGLAGHLVEMARGSRVLAEIDLAALPVFHAAADCLANDILSGAIERNQEYALAWVRVRDPKAERVLPILYDPQTSGGLLIALPAQKSGALVEAMHRRGHMATSVIGQIRALEAGQKEGAVVVTGAGLSNYHGKQETRPMTRRTNENASPPPATRPAGARAELECCSGGSSDAGPETAGPLAAFKSFLQAAAKPGRVDLKTKKLTAIALSIAHRCRRCLENHVKSARAMGITQAEIDEMAGLGVAFGGCSAMMFYEEVLKDLGA